MPDTPGKWPAGTLHLLARHRAMLEALLKEHLPEVEVWAYGSRVNGQSHDGSDLDLVLHGPAGYWSRRITEEHRLVYHVTDGQCIILQCRYHY